MVDCGMGCRIHPASPDGVWRAVTRSVTTSKDAGILIVFYNLEVLTGLITPAPR